MVRTVVEYRVEVLYWPTGTDVVAAGVVTGTTGEDAG